ncbi:unnamed protein product [Dibothriocephalus latus]|uniref:Uncharacterized protein n=1 Tax=Dibothriocephalus latus TaxID=60516 RepID=A0A3P7P3S8_DIBLA|nr:unnamed protein product [Dibothriocephalus latus]
MHALYFPTKQRLCLIPAISITNDESERTVSKPDSVWTNFLNKVASQRRLAIAALVLTVLTLAALVGLGAFFCYRRKFGAASPAKGRGKYRILYNTDGDEVVGNHHPLF